MLNLLPTKSTINVMVVAISLQFAYLPVDVRATTLPGRTSTPPSYRADVAAAASAGRFTSSRSVRNKATSISKARMAEQVKKAFLFSWNSYVKYAWGFDELDPMAKTGRNWYSVSFYMTPADAMDTMILMGLKAQADSARELVDAHLNFDQDVFVSNFEFTIRFLGGLQSSYELTGDKRLLDLAQDLANRELAAFKSPTGMPYTTVNLKTGAVKGANSNPAEIGTLLLEFGTLTKLTGDTVYYNTAKRALVKLFSLRSSIGLVGNGINVETGKWTGTDCSVSGGIDSYYEYLIKGAILFKDRDCRAMWDSSISAINRYLYDSTSTGVWYGHADMYTGKRTETMFGSLDAYFGDPLCLAGEVQRAAELEEAWFKVWEKYGIEPEVYEYRTQKVVHPQYYLRPEIMESAYYLYHYTNDTRYLKMGQTFFDDLLKYCKTDDGFVQLRNVVTHQKGEGMPSYFLAETLKYLYLMFAPPTTLDFNKIIFNTEAHPFERVPPMNPR